MLKSALPKFRLGRGFEEDARARQAAAQEAAQAFNRARRLAVGTD